MNKPKVSIIITAHNYAKYLKECIDSALNQNFDNYEIVIVDDGSTDETPRILKRYKKRYPRKIKIVTLNGVGLAAASNAGIKASKGEYIIRLDADDYFDENILLVESNYLDRHPEIGMVYADYFEIDDEGVLISYKRLMKLGKEIKTLDRPPLAAGAMYRRKCYDAVGGYNEALRYQEDYDFWTKFTKKFKVHNINLPLMYYRRHSGSMSTNMKPKMAARRDIKKRIANIKIGDHKILAIVPARAKSRIKGKLALRKLGRKPLIAYTIEEAKKCKLIDRLIVSTDDEEIAEVAKRYGAEVPFLRPKKLASFGVGIEAVVKHTLDYLKKEEGWTPDIVAVLHVPNPFKKEEHITEAINTLMIYDTDSVISVTEDEHFFWKPGKHGLEPVTFRKRLLKKDRETMYRENGAIYVFKPENLKTGDILGNSVGNILMDKEESLHIESEFDFWLAKQIIKKHNEKN